MVASSLPPVTGSRVTAAAGLGVANADVAALASRAANLPFHTACALLRLETGGRNVFGGDQGPRPDVFAHAPGAVPILVTPERFLQLFNVVVLEGDVSNGVGPCQITYAGAKHPTGQRDGGYFREMFARGLKPWDPYDNMLFGFEMLAKQLRVFPDLKTAGAHYNGGSFPNAAAVDYGARLVAADTLFRKAFGL